MRNNLTGIPHYDNAQILSLYADAVCLNGDLLFGEWAREIVTWLEREMVVDDLYAANLDADSEGVEGRFYVWSRDEVDDVLGPDAARFCTRYDVTRAGNWEGTRVLNRLVETGLADGETEAFLATCRAALLDRRESRVCPARDGKQLADWNALAIAALALALARAGAALERFAVRWSHVTAGRALDIIGLEHLNCVRLDAGCSRHPGVDRSCPRPLWRRQGALRPGRPADPYCARHRRMRARLCPRPCHDDRGRPCAPPCHVRACVR